MIPQVGRGAGRARRGRGVRSLIEARGRGALIVRRLDRPGRRAAARDPVVRNAAVGALATLHPASAAQFWAGHPSVEISLGLAEIGRASRERRPIDPQAFAMIERRRGEVAAVARAVPRARRSGPK